MNITTHLPIREFPFEDRPREKMVRLGPERMTTSELLAILLGSGTRQSSAVDMGKDLITRYDGLLNLARAELSELTSLYGIGLAKASKLAAAFELGRRKLQSKAQKQRLTTPRDIANYFRPRLVDQKQEVFTTLYLNSSCEVLGEKEIARGGQDQVIIDPKVIFREILHNQATGIVLCHNHPSGNPLPSVFDHSCTARLLQIAEVMGCKVVDHVIIASRGYYSYADKGKLNDMKRNLFIQMARE